MKRTGQTLVEFALAAPLLFLLLLGIIQYGLIFSASLTLRHAAQVSSRTLSLAGASTNNVSSIACQAISPMLDCARLQPPQVTFPTVGGNQGVQVTLRYNLPLIVSFVVPGASGNVLQLTATGVDRRN
jgi:Flp pilus assembly protein TadG